MARLNPHRPSAVAATPSRAQRPQPSAEVDRSPSPASDKENQGGSTAQLKHKAGAVRRGVPMSESPSDSEGVRGQKRKVLAVNASAGNEGEIADLRWYDPEQDEEERRKIRKDFHELQRDIQDNRDQYLQLDNNTLLESINRANGVFRDVKQTSDATIDSRFLVSAGDLAAKRAQTLAQGNGDLGIDPDEFISKCITFMQTGGAIDSADTRPGRRGRGGATQADVEDDDEGDALDWEVFGRKACYPFIRRPPVAGFLLGPLSVQKKARRTQRRARQQRRPDGPVTQPDVLDEADLQQQQSSSLRHKCEAIRTHLSDHLDRAEAAAEQLGELEEDEVQKHLRELRVCDNGEVSLFEFILNPRSFGQTVENLFYVSFLIKEGYIAIGEDSRGLPTLAPAQPHSVEEQRANQIAKHQAVLALDFPTWEQLVDALQIKEPLLPHRDEDEDQQQQPGARGWYGG